MRRITGRRKGWVKNSTFSDKKKLQKLITEAGFTPTKIANAIGITYKTVYRWLNKGIMPHPLQSRAIDELFKERVDITPVVYLKKRQFKKTPLYVLKHNKRTRERFLLAMAYYLSAVSASEMTLKETERIISGQIVKGKTLKQHLEVINHYNAIKYMLKELRPGFRITERYMLTLHSILMYNFSDKLPGRYKEQKEMPLKIKKFLSAVNNTGPEIIKNTSSAYCTFESIRPFAGGNLKAGRLIVTSRLLSYGFAPALITAADKQKHDTALEKAVYGNYKPITQLICQAILRGYDIISV